MQEKILKMVGVVERDAMRFETDMDEYLYSKRRRQPTRPKVDGFTIDQ